MLEKFVEVMDKQSKLFVRTLGEKSKNYKELNVAPLIDNCTLDIITGMLRTLHGTVPWDFDCTQ